MVSTAINPERSAQVMAQPNSYPTSSVQNPAPRYEYNYRQSYPAIPASSPNLHKVTMSTTLVVVIAVAVVVVVVGLTIFSVYMYLRHKRTTRKLEEAHLIYSQKEAEASTRKKSNWKQRLITRKTIKFLSPASQGEIRAEPVQPNSNQAGMKINQQLGLGASTQKPLLGRQSSNLSYANDELGSFDVAQYQSLLNYKLESADEFTGEPGGKNFNLGAILFALRYDFDNQSLELRIVRCTKLLAKDVGGTSDPYVKAVITPGSKKYYLETKIKMKTLNPEWKETFYFEGFPLSKLENKTLVLQVLDFDRFSKDDPIGEYEVQLGELNFYEPNIIHSYLSPCTGDRRGLGEIMLSLSYNQETSQLTVIVIKCRNLKAKDINGLSDPYVKMNLLQGGKRIDKKKTTIRMRDLNPTYNESFQFTIPRVKLKDSGLHIIVMDFDKWGSNELIGELILSSRSGTQEIKHWNEMMYRPKQVISEWHALKKIKKSVVEARSSASY